jgi:hypothetical protein
MYDYSDDSEERNYFGRQKPFDEYAMGVVQDTFERKLTKIIDDCDRKPRGSSREEISSLICSDRGKRRRGYFRR